MEEINPVKSNFIQIALTSAALSFIFLTQPLQAAGQTLRTTPNCAQRVLWNDYPGLLNCHLFEQANTYLSSRIVWDFNGQALNFRDWSYAKRVELGATFRATILWYESGMTNFPADLAPDVPVNVIEAAVASGTYNATIFDDETRWRLYKGQIALMLAAEIFNWVPWSVKDYESMSDPNLILSKLLDSDFARFNGRTASGASIFLGEGPVERLTPTNPITVFKFLKRNNLIGATRRATIERVLNWARWNLTHMRGDYSFANYFNYWQYWGKPPVYRIIEGTVSADPNSLDLGVQKRNWTSGCTGSAALFYHLLRAVNIPTRTVKVGQHNTIHFLSEDLYLSHADDPYTGMFKSNRPISDLFLDSAKFNAWFPASNPELANRNVGRQVPEINIQYPSTDLIKTFKLDLEAGRSHAQGWVYEIYSPWYTVTQLEDMGLWTRLESALGNLQ